MCESGTLLGWGVAWVLSAPPVRVGVGSRTQMWKGEQRGHSTGHCNRTVQYISMAINGLFSTINLNVNSMDTIKSRITVHTREVSILQAILQFHLSSACHPKWPDEMYAN